MKLGSKIQIAGWMWMFLGSTFVMLTLALAFEEMKMSEDLGMLSFSYSMYAGFIMILLGFRANRVLKDGQKYRFVDVLRVFRFFTLPQILLAISGFLYSGAPVFAVNDEWSAILLIAILGLTIAAIVIAIVRKVKSVKRSIDHSTARVVSTYNSSRGTGSTATVKQEPPKPTCYRCGAIINRVEYVIDGQTYCAECNAKITEPHKKGQCSTCKQIFEKNDLIYADGRYYCPECFNRTLPAHDLDNVLNQVLEQRKAGSAESVSEDVNIIALYGAVNLHPTPNSSDSNVALEKLNDGQEYRLTWCAMWPAGAHADSAGNFKVFSIEEISSMTKEEFINCVVDFVPAAVYEGQNIRAVRRNMRRELDKMKIPFKSEVQSKIPDDGKIYLFTYGETADLERYTTDSCQLYINANNGELTVKHFHNTDPFSLRAGCVSSSERKISYEHLAKILERDDIEDKGKYIALTQDNWEQWLMENNYL